MAVHEKKQGRSKAALVPEDTMLQAAKLKARSRDPKRERDEPKREHEWMEFTQKVELSPTQYSRYLEICANPPDAEPEVLAAFTKLKR
ncbi:hypothetical protein ACN28I_24275 [Archangium gephyra]|uniref:hypothetical protein n=1 Tax=Archangium gephyra TaxID=48 RepID=UPI003B82742A